MTEDIDPITSPCSRCGRSTWHNIKCRYIDNGGEEYNCRIHYMVIQCRGCKNTSFRYVFEDYEAAYPISNDEWDIPQTIETYPKFIKGHHELDGTRYVPEIVLEVYEESLAAIQEGAGILAGLGLRGTIEAICKDRGITEKNLEKRISRLATKGLISQKDAERLHAIRFLGNDAAHDIKKPFDKQIGIALKIIEHLITTVYVLDAEAKGKLDTIVYEYDEFKKILEMNLENYSSGDEFPLAKFLARDVRRIQGSLSQLESQLIAEIGAGGFTKLSVGKVDTFGSSPNNLQHFKLK